VKFRTWHIEHAVVVVVLSAVWLYTGRQPKEAVGAFAVYLAHGCSSIGARFEEREAQRAKPSVECYRWFWWYFVGKELCWAAYFVWSGAWSALVGCALFAAYPLWRKQWRKWHPLPKED